MTAEPPPGDAGEQVAIDPKALRNETDRMIDAITDPRYVEAVRAVRRAPDDERLAEATRQLSPDGLRRQGVPIPEGMRLSSRYFEPGLPSEVELGDVEPTGNVVNTLNEVAPGLLNRLRVEQPGLFIRLAESDDPTVLKPDPTKPLGVVHCICGGGTIPGPFHPTVCSGAGADLPF
jgi:hypothetical protein